MVPWSSRFNPYRCSVCLSNSKQLSHNQTVLMTLVPRLLMNGGFSFDSANRVFWVLPGFMGNLLVIAVKSSTKRNNKTRSCTWAKRIYIYNLVAAEHLQPSLGGWRSGPVPVQSGDDGLASFARQSDPPGWTISILTRWHLEAPEPTSIRQWTYSYRRQRRALDKLSAKILFYRQWSGWCGEDSRASRRIYIYVYIYIHICICIWI